MFAYINFGEQSLVPMAYGMLLVTAALVTVAVGLGLAVARGLPWRGVAICIVAMTLATVIGARLLHGLTNMSLYRADPGRIFRVEARDFALFGGLILASVVGLIVCRFVKIDVWKFADALAPAIGIGIAITRIGCFLDGCCFGLTTTLPWGVKYPAGSPAHLHQLAEDVGMLFQGPQAVHPTQLYELLAALTAGLLAIVFLRRQYPNGTAALIALIWFASLRWLISGLRVNSPTLAAPDWFYPLVYAAVIVGASIALIGRIREAGKFERRELNPLR